MDQTNRDLIELVETAEGSPVEIAERLVADMGEALLPIRDRKARIAAQVLDGWNEALDELELFLALQAQLRLRFTKDVAIPIINAGDEPAGRLFALMVLAHRAALVSEEILALLKGGFPAGGFVRCRTLHEVAVTAVFLCQHGAEEAAAWSDHDEMQSQAYGRTFNYAARKHGFEPISEADLAAVDARDRELKSRYGREFRGPFGWAHLCLVREDKRYANLCAKGQRNAGPTLLDLCTSPTLVDADLLAGAHFLYRASSYMLHGGNTSLADSLTPDSTPDDLAPLLKGGQVVELVTGPHARNIDLAIPWTTLGTIGATSAYVRGVDDPGAVFHRALEVSVELRRRLGELW